MGELGGDLWRTTHSCTFPRVERDRGLYSEGLSSIRGSWESGIPSKNPHYGVEELTVSELQILPLVRSEGTMEQGCWAE